MHKPFHLQLMKKPCNCRAFSLQSFCFELLSTFGPDDTFLCMNIIAEYTAVVVHCCDRYALRLKANYKNSATHDRKPQPIKQDIFRKIKNYFTAKSKEM
jgi:hypothetical protein